MKTTNKNHPVYRYMIDCIDTDGNTQIAFDATKLAYVMSRFKTEYDHEIKRKGVHKAFTDWLMGLPSCFNIDFENYKILEIAQLWGSLPEKATEAQEDKIIANWFNFITVKFFQICNRNKVSI